jgi:hypothetical protein
MLNLIKIVKAFKTLKQQTKFVKQVKRILKFKTLLRNNILKLNEQYLFIIYCPIIK